MSKKREAWLGKGFARHQSTKPMKAETIERRNRAILGKLERKEPGADRFGTRRYPTPKPAELEKHHHLLVG